MTATPCWHPCVYLQLATPSDHCIDAVAHADCHIKNSLPFLIIIIIIVIIITTLSSS